MAESLVSLKHDLAAVQNAVCTLLDKVRSPPNVPSWRYPEKLAANVELERSLSASDVHMKSSGEEVDRENRLLLTELMVDRLLLLMQLTIRLCDRNNSSSTSSFSTSSSTPLTLSSSVRKFCKCIVNQSKNVEALGKKVTLLQSKVTSMEEVVRKAEEECDLFKGALQHSQSGTPQSALGVRRGLKLLDKSTSYTSVAGVSQANPASHKSLPSKGQHNQQVDIDGGAFKHSRSSFTDVNKHDVCVQTLETSLAFCMKCVSHQEALLGIREHVSKLCSQLQLISLSTTDWKAMLDSGRLNTEKLVTSITYDLESVKASHRNLEHHCKAYQAKVTEQTSEMKQLKDLNNKLKISVDALEMELEKTKKKCDSDISCRENQHKRELEKVVAALRKAKEEVKELRQDLMSVKHQKAKLEAHQIKKEHERQNLEHSLAERKGLESQLRGVQARLQEQVSCIREELRDSQQRLEERCVQLSKNELHSQTLEKRCKYLQTKQASLLLHVDQLDEKCNQLQRDLSSALCDKEHLARSFNEVENECMELKKRVATQKDQLEATHGRYEELFSHSATLGEQLQLTESQLEEEKEKQHLLLEYPMFTSSLSGTFSSYAATLSSKQSREQLTANIIRILTLEEQNSELRKRTMETVMSDDEVILPGVNVMDHQVRLWQDVEWMKKEIERRKRTGTHSAKEINLAGGKDNTASSPTIQRPGLKPLRGKLGHLADALSAQSFVPSPAPPSPHNRQAWSSHQQQGSPLASATPHSIRDTASYSNITISMCSLCDRMFCSEDELTSHEQHCTA